MKEGLEIRRVLRVEGIVVLLPFHERIIRSCRRIKLAEIRELIGIQGSIPWQRIDHDRIIGHRVVLRQYRRHNKA